MSHNPAKNFAYVIQYSSFTPPPFISKCVLCLPEQVVIPSSPKLEIFGKPQGTRRIFFGFLRRLIGNENPFILVGDFP